MEGQVTDFMTTRATGVGAGAVAIGLDRDVGQRAEQVGVDADVTGSRTARYFVPSAFLREFVAALTYRRRSNLVGLALWTVVTALMTVVVVVG